MNSTLYRELVEFLQPYTHNNVLQNAVKTALIGTPALYQLVTQTSPQDFVTNLIITLDNFGDIQPGYPALVAVLEVLQDQVGINKQHQIEGFIIRIRAENKQKPPMIDEEADEEPQQQQPITQTTRTLPLTPIFIIIIVVVGLGLAASRLGTLLETTTPTSTLPPTITQTATPNTPPSPTPPAPSPATPSLTPETANNTPHAISTQTVKIPQLGVWVYNAPQEESAIIGSVINSEVLILGRSAGGKYLLIETDALKGWIKLDSNITISGNIYELPFINYVGPTRTPTPIPTNTATPTQIPADKILYTNDFERANTDLTEEWGIWTRTTVEDNGVWQGISESGSRFGIATWTDYALEFRFYLAAMDQQPGLPVFSVMFRADTNFSGGAYIFNANENSLDLDYKTDDTGWKNLPVDPINYSLQTHRWYTVRIEGQGDQLRVYMDNRRILAAQDEQFKQGIVRFVANPGTNIYFDNIRVWSLEP